MVPGVPCALGGPSEPNLPTQGADPEDGLLQPRPDVRGGSEGNSHTLRIHNSGITTVGFSTYFLFPSGSAPIMPTSDGAISLISFTVDRQGAVGLATQLLAGSSVNFS